MYITQQDLVNRAIEISAGISNSQALKDLIEADANSVYKQNMRDGQNYYSCNHTYVKGDVEFNQYRTRQVSGTDSAGNNTYVTTTTTNPLSPNIKKINPFYRNQQIQKVDYGLSNGVNIEAGEATENILTTLGREKDSYISEWATSAGNNAIGWVYVFVDKDGKFGWVVMNPLEIIPQYEDDTKRKLERIFRYYYVTKIIDGKESDTLIIEIYDGKTKEVYSESTSGLLSLQYTSALTAFGFNSVDETPESDLNENILDWGRPPFIELLNNPERVTDLQPIKSLIDDYDYQDSKMANDYAVLQEFILAIKGYSGEDPSELLEYIREIKAVLVDEDGGIEAVENKIPYEGKTSLLERTAKNIYKFGQAVDSGTETVSKASSGKALQIMYKPLETKVQRMYQQLSKSIYELLWFVNKYFEMTSNLTSDTIPTFDLDEVEISFKPDRVIDLAELADVVVKLSTILPKSKIYELLPFINQSEIDELIQEYNNENELLFSLEEMPVDTEE